MEIAELFKLVESKQRYHDVAKLVGEISNDVFESLKDEPFETRSVALHMLNNMLISNVSFSVIISDAKVQFGNKKS